MILVFSVTSRKSFTSLENWMLEATKYGVVEPVTVAICGNKVLVELCLDIFAAKFAHL
jgi:Ras family